MGQKTGIEWTESTWNPIRGCSRVSKGCRNCYAETVANRFKGPGEPYEGLIAKGGQWNGEVKLIEHKLDEPCRWSKPRMIFVNSMSDLFHPAVPFETIAGIFGIMAAASWHTFQVLTKRPERMLEFFQWIDQHPERKDFDNPQARSQLGEDHWIPFFLAQKASELLPNAGAGLTVDIKGCWPLENLWLGVSVEDQATADARIPLLLDTPAAVRWISAEPLLGPVDLSSLADPSKVKGTIHWVVVGGESGTYARPMHPNWPASLRDQCQSVGIPFLFKQWGEWAPETVCATEKGASTALYVELDGSTRPAAFGTRGQAVTVQKNGKKNTGRTLYGTTWDQYPEATA